MKDTEIEIQTRVEDVKPLLKFLQENGKKVFEDHQRDEYYTPVHRNFTDLNPIDEWLRIRESGKHTVTYKNWHHGEKTETVHCDEFETTIEDPESMRKIFKVLDIKPVVTVDKKRQSWLYKDYEISIDYVVGLGDFVEVEFKGGHTSKKPNEIAEEMINFLKEKGVGKAEINYVGYAYMLLNPKGDHFKVV